MDLNTWCFLMFVFLFIGFLVLEGFDYGVSMLLPFLGSSDTKRQAIVATLAPVWDGNEVWLVAAGAVLFAGFPHVYATLFSGVYLALLLILISLILRGVAFEFRDKEISRKWRSFWDWAIFCGGFIPALLLGIAATNLLKGVPIDREMQYTGTFSHLISLYTLVGGLVFVFTFLLHGAAYLTLKLDKQFIVQVRKTGLHAGKYAILTAAGFVLLTFIYTDLVSEPIASGILAASVVALVLCYRSLWQRQYSKSFVFSTIAIISLITALFAGLFPRVIISSLDPSWTLNIYNSASNPLTLKLMTTTMAIVLPVMLVLEGWKYYVFRQRICLTEIGFELRRKLWEQLRDHLHELSSCSYNCLILLEKVKHILASGRTIQADEISQAGTKGQSRDFKVLIQRGYRLIYIIDAMIKTLRKAPWHYKK